MRDGVWIVLWTDETKAKIAATLVTATAGMTSYQAWRSYDFGTLQSLIQPETPLYTKAVIVSKSTSTSHGNTGSD